MIPGCRSMKIYGWQRMAEKKTRKRAVSQKSSFPVSFIDRAYHIQSQRATPARPGGYYATAVFPRSSRIHCPINHQFRADGSRSISARHVIREYTRRAAHKRRTNVACVFGIGEQGCEYLSLTPGHPGRDDLSSRKAERSGGTRRGNSCHLYDSYRGCCRCWWAGTPACGCDADYPAVCRP